MNGTQQNQIKSNKIKLKEIKSIYPSDHVQNSNYFLNGMMDEMDKVEFQNIISKSQVGMYSEKLGNEIIEVMKEIYMNPNTRTKILNIDLSNIDYALKEFSKANTKTDIQKPKAYFKQCLISALEQTELSKQLDTDTIYRQMGSG